MAVDWIATQGFPLILDNLGEQLPRDTSFNEEYARFEWDIQTLFSCLPQRTLQSCGCSIEILKELNKSLSKVVIAWIGRLFDSFLFEELHLY